MNKYLLIICLSFFLVFNCSTWEIYQHNKQLQLTFDLHYFSVANFIITHRPEMLNNPHHFSDRCAHLKLQFIISVG